MAALARRRVARGAGSSSPVAVRAWVVGKRSEDGVPRPSETAPGSWGQLRRQILAVDRGGQYRSAPVNYEAGQG
jgi:hypothetical protein